MKRLLLVLMLLGLGAWQTGFYPHWEEEVAMKTTIRTIVDDPEKLRGQRVTIKGLVTGRISFLGASAFTINDGEYASVDVVGFTGAPEPGGEVTVTGRLTLIKSMNGYDMPVIYVN